MKLSILDPVQIPRGMTSSGALQSSICLAQHAEKLGYTRYWVVEHHGICFEANPAPEVFVAALANATSTIRIGAGGVLLNHYSPYKAAEAMRTLEALFPGRIDVGIGRATAGLKADTALKRFRAVETPDDHEDQVQEFVGWLGNDLPETSQFQGLSIMNDESAGPLPWILAATEGSAIRAAHHGLALACSAFHVPANAPGTVAAYRQHFRPSNWRAGLGEPQALLALRVVIGETQREAERLAMPVRAVFKLRREEGIFLDALPDPDEAERILGGHVEAEDMDWPDYVVGTPERVRRVIERMASETGVDEFMVQDFVDKPEIRLRNYTLLAGAFDQH
ncbi:MULTISPECIES: MsnO8 family LLM class oxidoreductase [Alphaproteobacteria]|uniref:Alkane monooxygenase n=2 Tax=Alphaproteobacteria TaxID=28211 RepID=A0A512HPQ2_9HYPH|nr:MULTISPECIES: MsnO8 family LLM class oxidoreductase [Alphaproteobacteria]GEO87350.1 alkane monooxygenase [Ciceribacter naphthalenivorans]GLR24036.1 alkane monooxygenase [Ciceribacter naphthalenivorans]GLT06892.1 alkane monooxygenase [Sphingomonas psychrolutea]